MMTREEQTKIFRETVILCLKEILGKIPFRVRVKELHDELIAFVYPEKSEGTFREKVPMSNGKTRTIYSVTSLGSIMESSPFGLSEIGIRAGMADEDLETFTKNSKEAYKIWSEKITWEI